MPSCPLSNACDPSSGATRPLPKDGGAEEYRRDPTIEPRPKIWTRDSTPLLRTSKLQQSLIYQGVKIWNSIPSNIINQHLNKFKHSF